MKNTEESMDEMIDILVSSKKSLEYEVKKLDGNIKILNRRKIDHLNSKLEKLGFVSAKHHLHENEMKLVRDNFEVWVDFSCESILIVQKTYDGGVRNFFQDHVYSFEGFLNIMENIRVETYFSNKIQGGKESFVVSKNNEMYLIPMGDDYRKMKKSKIKAIGYEFDFKV